ncbi:MAG: type II secretion system F family protein [Bulleidia sp.]
MIDREDCQGIQRLMESGFTLQESMDLLASGKSSRAFAEIRRRLEDGEEAASFFQDYCPKEYRGYFSGFLQTLPFRECLSLAIAIAEGDRKEKEAIRRKLFYPCAMLGAVIAGIFLFTKFCFPPLLSMVKSFHGGIEQYVLIQNVLKTSCVILSIVLAALTLLVLFFLPEARQKQGYLLLQKVLPDSLLIQYVSMDFIRFFHQCLSRNIPTRRSLHLLKTISHKPVIRFLAEEIEKGLLEGNPLEQAVDLPGLDPALARFMKLAVYSGNAEEMLKGYLEMSEEKGSLRIARITRIIQGASYASIGVVLILIYQILMMPLQILTQI